MRGRIKGDSDRIIILAHQTEIMARQKTIKPVSHYLKTEKPKNGAADVLAMFKRFAERSR